METKSLWCVFNTQNDTVLFIYVYEWQAENKKEYLWEFGPTTGTKPNKDKIEVMRLSDAIKQIQIDACYYGAEAKN